MIFLNLINFCAGFFVESFVDRDSCAPELEIVNEDNPLELACPRAKMAIFGPV